MHCGASTRLLFNGEMFDSFPTNAGPAVEPASGALFAPAFHGLIFELASVYSLGGARVVSRRGVFAHADDMTIGVAKRGEWRLRSGPVLDAFSRWRRLCR